MAGSIKLGDEPWYWVSDDQFDVYDFGVDSRVVPKFWAFGPYYTESKLATESRGELKGYGWIGVIAGDEAANPASWQVVRYQTATDPFGINQRNAAAPHDSNVEGVIPKNIRGRRGTPREGWTIDSTTWVPVPPGAAPKAPEPEAPIPATPVSKFAQDYAEKRRAQAAEKYGQYKTTRGTLKAASEHALGRKLAAYDQARIAAEQRTAEYNRRLAEMESSETVVGGKLLTNEAGGPVYFTNEPGWWVSGAQVNVFGQTPKFWVWMEGKPAGRDDVIANWRGVLEGNESDPSSWVVLKKAGYPAFAGDFSQSIGGKTVWQIVQYDGHIRGRQGTPREGWTVDGEWRVIQPDETTPEAPPATTPETVPTTAPSKFASDYSAARRAGTAEAYSKYTGTRKTLQTAIEKAQDRAMRARLGPDVLGEEELLKMIDSYDDVGRMSESLDPSEFDERPYLDVFKSTQDAVRGDDDLDIFSPPPDAIFPRFREEIRKFQADEPSVRVLRIDTDSTYDEFVGASGLEEAVRELQAKLDEHMNDPNAHRASRGWSEVVGLAHAVSNLRRTPVRGDDGKISITLPSFAKGKVRCWREGDDVMCSLRFAAEDGTVRVATAAARQPEFQADALADSMYEAGMDAVEVLGALPGVIDEVVGSRLARDLAGAVLAISHRDDVLGVAPAVITRKSTTDSALAATMALLQAAGMGDKQAQVEVEKLRLVAATPLGARAVAPLLAAGELRLAQARPAGLVDRFLSWLGV